MADFPTLSRKPGKKGWSVTPCKEAVHIGRKASGLPVVNELFTFSPLTFTVPYYLATQEDYEDTMTHYNVHKGIPFNWTNTQKIDTPVTYEVIYAQPPKCQLDKLQDRWQINVTFRQYS